MKKVGKIILYKPREVIEILKKEYIVSMSPSTLHTKLVCLDGFVEYDGTNYIPHDIIHYIPHNIKKKQQKLHIKSIISIIKSRILPIINEHQRNTKTSTIKPINKIRVKNKTTRSIIKAILEVQNDLQNLKDTMEHYMKEIDYRMSKIEYNNENFTKRHYMNSIINKQFTNSTNK